MSSKLRLTTHPDLEESYLGFLKLLGTSSQRRKSNDGFYQRLGVKLGMVKRESLGRVARSDSLFVSSVFQDRILKAPRRKRTADKEKLSVIVCSKGRASLIAAIESLVHQTVQPDEILIFLDGVDQQKLEKIRKKIEAICVCPVRMYFSNQTRGPGYGRNYLVQQASHELLVFFDDDNLAFPIFIECLLATYLRFHVAAVTTSRISFTQSKRSSSPVLQDLIVPFGSDLIAGLSFDLMGDSTMIISKRTFNSVGGFSVRLDVHEDTFLLNKICLRNEVIMPFPMPTLFYRRTKNSRMQDVDMDIHDQLLMKMWSQKLKVAFPVLRQFRAVGLARTMVHRMTESKTIQLSFKKIKDWQLGKWS